jgi:hypothetical protein
MRPYSPRSRGPHSVFSIVLALAPAEWALVGCPRAFAAASSRAKAKLRALTLASADGGDSNGTNCDGSFLTPVALAYVAAIGETDGLMEWRLRLDLSNAGESEGSDGSEGERRGVASLQDNKSFDTAGVCKR